MTLANELDQEVGWRSGVISPAIYFDDEVYAMEQERVSAELAAGRS